MRHKKPIPKESSFKAFSDNQAKDPRRNRSNDRKPGVSAKIKKMFNDRSDKRGDSRGSSSGRNDSRGSSGTRTTFSGKTASSSGSSSGSSYSRSSDSRGSSSGRSNSYSRSNDSRGSRDSGSRSTFSGRNDSRGNSSGSKFSDRGSSYSRDSGRSDSRGPQRDSRDYRPRSNDRSDSRGSFSRGRDDRRDDTRKSDRKPSNGKHDRRTSRGKSFKDDRRNDRSTREMHDAVCQKCNKPCKVPFKPTQGKGVSCSDCFETKARVNDSQYGKKTGGFGSSAPRKKWDDIAPSMRGAERRARDGIPQRGFTKPQDNGQRFAETKSGRKELFDAVCMKCKSKCKVPFKPTGKMGVSCTNCYNKNDSPFKGGKFKPGSKTHGQKINDSNKSAYGKRRY